MKIGIGCVAKIEPASQQLANVLASQDERSYAVERRVERLEQTAIDKGL